MYNSTLAEYIMEYSFDIFDKNPERLATILAENCRKHSLDCNAELDIDKIVKIRG